MRKRGLARGVQPIPPPRILGLDRELFLWIVAVIALVIIGIVLDMFWGNL